MNYIEGVYCLISFQNYSIDDSKQIGNCQCAAVSHLVPFYVVFSVNILDTFSFLDKSYLAYFCNLYLMSIHAEII